MKQGFPFTHLHPLIARWFTEKFDEPTDIQKKAWPKIAAHEHLLITAPTGSGKTLTAFLWALNQLITRQWPEGEVHVLYISPLRALNNDIQRNLLTPLEELSRIFHQADMDFPHINVLTRSGDTPQSTRRRMLSHPPEILITTPESLNLMISSPRARGLFTSLKTVIMDEIHSIAQAKRGTHMITAVDRLVRLSGEFQRIALSATVKPLSVIADFIGGFKKEEVNNNIIYTKRPVTIISSDRKKPVHLRVEFPEKAREQIEDNTWWPALVKDFKERITRNRSTLLFTNTRKLSEKITHFINQDEPELIAYAHHGSLSKEIRALVEEKLKNGELKAIVATSSLELGIDIGELDEVILIESPPTVSSGLQRIGRAGHGVDDVIRGSLYPTHGKDFLLAAVSARSIMDKDIEDVAPVTCPLDVLAQVITSMTCMEVWDRDGLYDFIKTTYPFHTLSRRQYDITIDMLTGKYAGTRIRELNPRLIYDRIDNTLKGRKGTISLLYLSGGTIPDRGYFDLKVNGTNTKIGTLDEEFVWERRVGNIFCLGTRAWKIVNMDHQKVEVIPWDSRSNAIPFWKADRRNADPSFMEKVRLFCEQWNNRLDDPGFIDILETDYYMVKPAARELISFLKRQKEKTGTDLPHRHHLIIEHCTEGVESPEANRVILHTLWGGKLNYPYSLALSTAWEERYSYPLEVFSNDFCIMILLPHHFDTHTLLDLVQPDSIEYLLRKKLESTGLFGGLFRENAGRALLLPRMDFNKRLPLWLTRLRAKKLFSAVLSFTDFPILAETWRSCFTEEFDINRLKQVLGELMRHEIRISEIITENASPFAEDLIWRQTDNYMYADDSPPGGPASRLADDIIKEVIADKRLRPKIKPHIIDSFVQKIQRLLPGYEPGTTEELLEWIKERLLIPEKEWHMLISPPGPDTHSAHNTGQVMGTESGPDMDLLDKKALKVKLPGSEVFHIMATENLPRLLSAPGLSLHDITVHPLAARPGMDPASFIHTLEQQIAGLTEDNEEDTNGISIFDDFFSQWCRYYGPLSLTRITSLFGTHVDSEAMCLRLAESGDIIIDEITEGTTETEVCDTENFERLLRLSRKKAQPECRIRPASHLPLFLATWQGITSPSTGIESLKKALEQLFGYPAPPGTWERDIFPARVDNYDPSLLDNLLYQSNLIWCGCKKNRICFTLSDDTDLFLSPHDTETRKENEKLFPGAKDTCSFWEILDHTHMKSEELTKRLWDAVWRGGISNDSFTIIRSGMGVKFRPESIKQSPLTGTRRIRGPGYSRWKSSRPTRGSWFPLHIPTPGDTLYNEELKRERVRQLLQRYGILFRELLLSELSHLQWKEMFKTLYLMELSGEITSGYFFEDIRGPQFISKEAITILSGTLPENGIYWMNTTDPAYPYDALKNIDKSLPFRHESSHIVFHGPVPVLISRKKGKDIEIRVEPRDPDLPTYLTFFNSLTNRKVNPLATVKIEKINDLPVSQSPYADVLTAAGFQLDYNRLILRGGY